MKKIILVLIAMVISTMLFSTTAFASQQKTGFEISSGKLVSENVEYFYDGSYITITVIEEQIPTTRAAAQTKVGSKNYSLRNADGDILWTFTVNGKFSVNTGVSVTAITNSSNYKIYDDAWHNTANSSSRSANKVTGKATFKKKLLFFDVETRNCTVTLSCDKYGNLS